MKIALVIGHASDKQGAWGNAGLSEFVYWEGFVNDTIDSFPDHHEYKIFYRPTKNSGYTSRMKGLHQEIDAWGADVSISMHFNAAANPKANGHEVLYCSKTGKVYADLMNDGFADYMDLRDRGLKKKTRKDRGGGFLCRGRSVCILIEPFFAAHQTKYIKGTKGYKGLQEAFRSFFRII